MSSNTVIYVVTKHKIDSRTDNAPEPIMEPDLVRVFFRHNEARAYYDTLEILYQQGPITIQPTLRTLKFSDDLTGWYDCDTQYEDDFDPETWYHTDYVLVSDNRGKLFMQPKEIYDPELHDVNFLMEFSS